MKYIGNHKLIYVVNHKLIYVVETVCFWTDMVKTFYFFKIHVNIYKCINVINDILPA